MEHEGDVNGVEDFISEEGSQRSNNNGFEQIPLSPRRKLLARLNLQGGGDSSTSGENSPLCLKLTKTPSLLDLLEQKLNEAKDSPPESNNTTPQLETDKKKNKATNFPAKLLRIGSWTRKSIHEGDLVAKCYYAKKKIVWELLNGPLKSKIEIPWEDICAIRALTRDSRMGVLEIELMKPPKFYQETTPQPRKHTNWEKSFDFTQGQALIWRRHHIEFSPGTLDKHYENILQCDDRLLDLSQRVFPVQQTQFIYPNTINFINSDHSTCDPTLAPVPPHMHYQSPFVLPQMQYQFSSVHPQMLHQSSSVSSHIQYQPSPVLPQQHLATRLVTTNSPISGGFAHNPDNVFQTNEIEAYGSSEIGEFLEPSLYGITEQPRMMSYLCPEGACLGTNEVLEAMEQCIRADSLLLSPDMMSHLDQPNIVKNVAVNDVNMSFLYGDTSSQPVYDPQPIQRLPPQSPIEDNMVMREMDVEGGVDHGATMWTEPVFSGSNFMF